METHCGSYMVSEISIVWAQTTEPKYFTLPPRALRQLPCTFWSSQNGGPFLGSPPLMVARPAGHRQFWTPQSKAALRGGRVWWTRDPPMSRPPTHVPHRDMSRSLQPILRDYAFCSLFQIVYSQIRSEEGPSEPSRPDSRPQNSRSRLRGPGRPFTTAILSQGHARTEFCLEFSASLLPPRRPAPPVQPSSSQPRFRPNPPATSPTCQARCTSMIMSIYICSGRRAPEFGLQYILTYLHGHCGTSSRQECVGLFGILPSQPYQLHCHRPIIIRPCGLMQECRDGD